MKKKICFICSSGGHFSELSKLGLVAQKYNSFLITEKTEKFDSDFCDKIYFLKIINRKEKLFFIHFLFIFMRELFIFITERPTIVITTGALCSYPMVLISKFFRKKIIYIESIARINDLSLTGKKIYNKADLFFVQWPSLTEKYDKAIYVGNLFGKY